jgi:hypothetical protein
LYAERVAKAEYDKMLEYKQKEINDFNNVRQRYDNEKEFIERQKA